MTLPFDGAISKFYNEEIPEGVRDAIRNAEKDDILAQSYPYEQRMDRDDYDDTMKRLQVELMKLQAWVKKEGKRVAIVFEGRDASGKGGTIKRFRENMNPRNCKIVALSKPTEEERGQWYFQRYVKHMPTAGQITLFDRSWYNRGVVEDVFGFCAVRERQHFFAQVPDFEKMLVDDGIILIKLWLNVGRAEQLRRMLAREKDKLKQWKLSTIDVEGLHKWDAYSEAISETFEASDTSHARWTVIRSDDKRRARISALRKVLNSIHYANKDDSIAIRPDDSICGGVDMWNPNA
ncbi:polyphosphate kinase 2, PA0141 family [Litoreibacter ascidiaceicola]|uniref:ADP/GDP-polyphosphate phosphotransferase n=1 Tax=Litoreibacter ascidiaceicola TaxID=1486859 RepID=A0A1M4VRE6_9RHOB|nr:polyphosphate kinase 2 [Litoreibacter ascidiaceicola]SHE71427.1 polyphosphate kinase 2, PA0141 family [Litoreibacter ascidiaceicola]